MIENGLSTNVGLKYQRTHITLNLIDAAKLLGIDKETLRRRAVAGLLPGARVGRAWRFLEADLVAYLRSLYPNQASQGAICGSKTLWHYKKNTTCGGLTSRTKVSEYEKALGLK